jgi:hypothetical protein
MQRPKDGLDAVLASWTIEAEEDDRPALRAALIYQHDARGEDQAIMGAIGSHVQAEHDKNARGNDDGDQAGRFWS